MKKMCFVPYVGGKFSIFGKLNALMPEHHTYVEVFGGGASFLLNKDPSRVECYNDINGDMTNLFVVVRDKLNEFLERCELLIYSKELLNRFKNAKPEDDIERAVRTYYLLRCSFSAAMVSWSRSKKENRAKSFFNSFTGLVRVSRRLQNVQVDQLDFRECIKKWDSPRTFFFLDPPYYGLNYYVFGFTERDHIDLRILLGKTKGKWLLTYNDHSQILNWYKKYDIIIEQMKKTASYAKAGTKRADFGNAIIANYPILEKKKPLYKIR
ncbi:MAG: DNA adenine methylase [Desulfobacterales bacterium]|nr:DNA adenine methylase [Desulfobacterales bacterium]